MFRNRINIRGLSREEEEEETMILFREGSGRVGLETSPRVPIEPRLPPRLDGVSEAWFDSGLVGVDASFSLAAVSLAEGSRTVRPASSWN